MSKKFTSSALKVVALVVVIFATGVAGVLVGHVLRGRLSGTSEREVTMPVPMSMLHSGMMFPDAVVTGENGAPLHSGEMIGGGGCVVLFLDLECPPCKDMVDKWQRAMDDGVVAHGQLWGVSYHSRAVVDEYVKENQIMFPIVTDSLQTFLKEYKVNRFPLEVVVGASGKIRSTSYNSEEKIDAGRIADLLAD